MRTVSDSTSTYETDELPMRSIEVGPLQEVRFTIRPFIYIPYIGPSTGIVTMRACGIMDQGIIPKDTTTKSHLID